MGLVIGSLKEVPAMKRSPQIPVEELKVRIERTKAFLSTPEGRKQLQEAFRRGEEEAERIKKACIPTLQSLEEPCTI
jgi:hypothetical protein